MVYNQCKHIDPFIRRLRMVHFEIYPSVSKSNRALFGLGWFLQGSVSVIAKSVGHQTVIVKVLT